MTLSLIIQLSLRILAMKEERGLHRLPIVTLFWVWELMVVVFERLRVGAIYFTGIVGRVG